MSETPTLQHFIGGKPTAPASGEYFESTNPATRDVLYQAARGNAADIDAAVASATEAFNDPRWRDLSQTKRGHLLRRLGDLVGEHAEELARSESLDNGKLLREMRGQLATLPEYYYYYAGLADKIHGDVIPTSDRQVLNYTMREPLGVVGAITPWNSPLTLTTSKLAPALCAGNTVVIKPSEYTSATVLKLAELIIEAGFPPGAVNVVTGFGAEAGQPLVDHPGLAKISFTGSTATGSRIASATAGRFIGSTLELGGKSPNIVFDDANIANAATGVVAGIFAAAGQTCIAGSRVFAQRAIYDELLSASPNERAASGWVIRSTTTPSSAHWRSRASATRWRPTSTSAVPRAPGFSPAGAPPTVVSVGSSTSLRFWWTSPTRCGWCARRSSGRSPRSCRSIRRTRS